MRILYAAIDQRVPGTTGGSTHVQAVAEGLARLGHEVHVLAMRGDGPLPVSSVEWHPMGPPFGARQARLLRAGRVRALARTLQPDIIIERYYNFGGEGILAARRLGLASALEINAPVVDYPGSPKRRLDRLLVVEPMRRWREWQCRVADLLITPSPAVLPSWVSANRIVRLEWGADTGRFRPDIDGPAPFKRQAGDTIAVFAGAFRSWHGAIKLVRAVERLRERGRTDIKAVLIGEGPELGRVRQAAARVSGVTITGALPHDRMPACLAGADIGVAPFDVSAHAPLGLDFYWSPLKIFEYMAAGLPVVAPAVGRLKQLVSHGSEGILYDPADPNGLASALEQLSDSTARRSLGDAARARAVREFSWDAHCKTLDAALREVCQCRSLQ